MYNTHKPDATPPRAHTHTHIHTHTTHTTHTHRHTHTDIHTQTYTHKRAIEFNVTISASTINDRAINIQLI
mgnify:FL=1